MQFKKALLFSAIFSVLIGCDEGEKASNDSLKQGIDFYAKGDLAQAELEFKNAIQKNPSVAESYYYMALLNEKSRNFRSMRENLNESLKLDPKNNNARIKYGKVLLVFNDIESSLKEIETVLAEEPNNLEALSIKAAALAKSNNNEQALTLINSILDKDPRYLDALELKASLQIKNNAYNEALSTIEAALAIDDKNLNFHALKIELHSKKNDMTAVVADYQKIIETHPENDDAKYGLAAVYTQIDKKQQAEELLTQLVNDKPKNLKAKLMLTDFLYTENKEKGLAKLHEFTSINTPGLAVNLAKWAVSKNEINEAKNILNMLANNDDVDEKDRAIALLALASIAFQNNDYQTASDHIKKSLEFNSSNIDTKILQAQIFINQEQYPQAEEALNKILWEKPDSDDARVLLAKMYTQIGDKDQANANFNEALKINPSNSQALIAVVENALNGRHYEYARTALLRAQAKQPDNMAFRQMLIKVNIADKQWDNVENNILELSKTPQGQFLAKLLKAQAAAAQGQCDQALSIYQQFIEQIPSHDITSLTAIADCYTKTNKPAMMIDALNNFLEQQQSYIPGYLLRSQLLTDSGNTAQAIASLEQALGREGDLSRIYLQLAALYLKQDNKAMTLKLYQQGLENSPANIELLTALANYYERNAIPQEAIKTYEKVLSVDSKAKIAKNNLANLLLQTNQPQAIDRAVELTEVFKQSTQPYFLDTYALAQFKKGNMSAAANAADKVIILAPEVPVFRYHLAQIYQQQGNVVAAEAELRQALELGKKQSFAEQKEAEALLASLIKSAQTP